VLRETFMKLKGTATAETELQEIGVPEEEQTVANPPPLAANLPARLASVTPPWSSWAWLTLTGPPNMAAMKINNPSPVAIRSFINFIILTPFISRFH
jgi:hypothetical protein